MDDDQFLTPSEAAEVLGVSVNQIYKSIAEGKIRATKVGERVGIRASDLLPSE